MGMYKKWNCALCKELCDAFEKFECAPTMETLCLIKEISETINNIEEMEAAGAMRHYAEEKFGYNSETGHFDKDIGNDWDDYDLGMFGIYDAARRRDSRGRFMSNRRGGGRRMMRGPYNVHYPPYYNMDDEEDEKWDEDEDGMMGVQNAGGRSNGSSMRSNGNRGGGSRTSSRSGSMMNNGGTYNYGEMPPYYDDGNMYRVRQEGGRPMMERMYAHGDKEMKPKKLTKEQYEEWAKHLENSDGTRGPHFSKEEVKQIAHKMGIDFKDFTEEELWLASCIMYSDYCETIGSYTKSPDAYVKLAIDFLEDEDAKEDGSAKLAAYYYSIVE